MRLERSFMYEQLIECSIQPVLVDLLFTELQQVGRRRAPIPVILARRPPTGRLSLRLRTRLPDGGTTHTWLNFDHARVTHSDAVIDAYESGSSRELLSTVSSDNLRLLTALENQYVIEVYRRGQRKIAELRARWAGAVTATGS